MENQQFSANFSTPNINTGLNTHNVIVKEDRGLLYRLTSKSYFLAYLFWAFLWCVGASRFYTRNKVSAIIILIGSIVLLTWLATAMHGYHSSTVVQPIHNGYVATTHTVNPHIPAYGLFSLLSGIWVLWWMVDLFLTHYNVRRANFQNAAHLGLIDSTNIPTCNICK